ncbi:probable methyltransferase PMT5 [Salvia hispanica]|uniref:probable methyltransferase PMT5 n=1 Tax=Salvia hispanica TaxID=49212 RepID=UPI002009343C|nr:probable methyltransferase PMT5 [Salvia hispanica]XP_047953568.1 probable methyltransferase PMT5 [Salvia hispanica]XP_047953570.1 probable methyltransferase PMT5 [Salvia hispanica]XP_047961133.1 probable methyltransferase PMT5 [Salvia hispanica]XP_047961134.1 probable methyltransferase PMT5 [Salvia hispanica]
MLKTRQKLEMRTSSHNNLPFVMSQRPQINWLMLCVITVFGLIALSRSYLYGKFDSATASARPNIYSSYRRLRAQAVNNYLELRNLGANRVNDYGPCGKEMENGVPCYNVSANLLAGFKDGEEFDRHCEVLRNTQHCLTRSPKDYKIPLTWPGGRDVIWSGNVKLSKDQFLSSGSKMKRLMLLEENQIAFHSNDGMTADDVRDYSNQIAKMIGLGSDNEFHQAGVRNVLDIGCGFGSFGAHLLSLKLMAVCMAAYESTGSQVQLALERGLPAIIGNFFSRQLPFPSLSYDMVHCAQCGIFWDDKDGMFLIEVDRVLKPGGYLVLTSPRSRGRRSSPGSKRGSASSPFEQFIKTLCWNLLSEQDGTFIWQKTTDSHCYASIKDLFPLCEREDGLSYYKPLVKCISGTTSKHWTPIQNRSSASLDFQIHGIHPQEFSQDLEFWRSSLRNYWPLLSPLIFSDHPKRPSDEDPVPPHNMVRNVMDMNANYGGLNAALLEGGHSVWVMNVVPMGESSTLPFILDQGFAGVVHNWCEPFPTYSRTYDMLHAKGLLSHLASDKCSITDLIFDMDRILRPEGWVVISDKIDLIEKARTVAARLHWEARVIDVDNGTDQRLLLCQKPFFTN